MMFYGHFWARGRLNGPNDLETYWSEVKDETPFRRAHVEDVEKYQNETEEEPIVV